MSIKAPWIQVTYVLLGQHFKNYEKPSFFKMWRWKKNVCQTKEIQIQSLCLSSKMCFIKKKILKKATSWKQRLTTLPKGKRITLLRLSCAWKLRWGQTETHKTFNAAFRRKLTGYVTPLRFKSLEKKYAYVFRVRWVDILIHETFCAAYILLNRVSHRWQEECCSRYKCTPFTAGPSPL